MPAPALATGPRVLVVGGGVAGLTTALEVVRARPDARVTVLERAERVGGKLRLDEVGGHLVDVGAEAMLAVRPEAVDLVERLGAGQELVSPATTAASVWSRGALHPLPRATLMGVPTDPESARGILTDSEVERVRDEQAWPGGRVVEDVSVGEYVGSRLGRAVVDRLVEPLLGGVYAGHAGRLSLEATMPALWRRAVAGESLLAPGPAPAPAGDGSRRPAFAGLRGGVGRLPGLLAEALEASGVELRTGATVRGLERSGSGWRLVLGSAADPEAVEGDAVVLCVPPPPAARLVRPHAPAAADLLAGVEMASTAVVTVAVERAGLGGLAGSGFLVPPVEGRTIKASTFSFLKWGWTGSLSDDVVHLRASVGRAGEEAVLQRPDDELVAVALTEVSEALGRPVPRVVDAHVQRWGGGLPQYTVGHLGRVRALRAGLARLPGLAVAGAAYDGVGIPAVIASAATAARTTIDHLSTLSIPRGEHPR